MHLQCALEEKFVQGQDRMTLRGGAEFFEALAEAIGGTGGMMEGRVITDLPACGDPPFKRDFSNRRH